MSYQTLYLRWRPSGFDTLVGQAPVKQALMNSLTSGRIAHAYLFTGPRGTGKTTTARIFAKALNCQHGPTDRPCGQCLNCRQITEGSAMDVQELDAASNRGVEDIKNLNKNVDFAPVSCRYKVYIIDEAHMLTAEACNALLKTLEEPPAHVVFILATTEPQKILPTIHSRCQRFDFRPITHNEIVEHLQKVAAGSDIEADKEALELIAAVSEGGMRDALSLLEQCGVMAETVTTETVRSVRGIVGREILRELVGAIGRREVAAALEIFDRLLMQGKDIKQILEELSGYLRALLLYKAAPSYSAIYVTDTEEALSGISSCYTGERILAAQEIIHQAVNELRFTAKGRIAAEMCLYDLCRENQRTIKALAARIQRLEEELSLYKRQNAQQGHDLERSEATSNAKPELSQADVSLTKQEQKPTEQYQPKIETATVTEAAPQEDRPQENFAAFTPYSGCWAEGDEYWTKTLEILRLERKNAIASCAANATVLAYENKVLTLGFKMKFLCDRLQKPDYSQVIEEILLRVARSPIRLQCVIDAGKKTSQKSRSAAGEQEKNGGDKSIFSVATGVTHSSQKQESSPGASGSDSKKEQAEASNVPLQKFVPHIENALAVRKGAISEESGVRQVADSTKKAMEMFGATLHKV